MVIRCVRCGRVVSDEIPDSIKLNLRAFVECHHCVNDEVFSDRVVFQQLTLIGIKSKFFELFMKCKFKKLNMELLKEVMLDAMNKAIDCKFTKDGYYAMLMNDADKVNIMKEQKKAG